MARKLFGWFLVLAAVALGVYTALATHSLMAIYGDPAQGVLSAMVGPFVGIFAAMLALASALLVGGLALTGHRRVWLPSLAGFLVVSVLAVGVGTWTGLESKQRYLDEQGAGMRQDGVTGESGTDARGPARTAAPGRVPV